MSVAAQSIATVLGDEELRRFLQRYVTRELQKKHVVHLGEVIDASWPMIAAQFLEPGPRD